MAHVTVKQNQEQPIAAEVLAESIRKIGESMKRLNGAGLTERAIVLLVSDASNENKTTVQRVLKGLESLQRLYLVPVKK